MKPANNILAIHLIAVIAFGPLTVFARQEKSPAEKAKQTETKTADEQKKEEAKKEEPKKPDPM